MRSATNQPTSRVINPLYTTQILTKSARLLAWEVSKGERYAAYRQRWMGNPGREDVGGFPIGLNLEITTRCNMACTFCYHSEFKPHELGDMSWALFQKMMDEGAEHGLATVTLNGIGEPLLHRDLVRMVDYAHQRGVLDIMFYTNGSIMDGALAEQLIRSGLDQITFSIDSPDRATYESIRLYGKYDSVVANVRALIRVRDRLGSLTPIVRVAMAVTRRTMHQADDFLHLWETVADQVMLQDMLFSIKAGGASSNRNVRPWVSREESPFELDANRIRALAMQRGEVFVCSQPFQRLSIYWDGRVVPCCGQPLAKQFLLLGDVRTQSIYDIWNGARAAAVRQAHREGRWHENPACRTCDVALIELHKRQLKDAISRS